MTVFSLILLDRVSPLLMKLYII